MWRWITDGDKQGVQFGDNTDFYELGAIPTSRKIELANAVNLQSAIWSILYSARNIFATGAADYRNAVENLSELLPELFKATEQLEKTATEILYYLAPTLVMPLTKLEDRATLAKEIVLRAMPPLPPVEKKSEK